MNVGAPRRHRDFYALAFTGDKEAEALKHAAGLQQWHRQAGEAFELGQRKIDDVLGRVGAAGDCHL